VTLLNYTIRKQIKVIKLLSIIIGSILHFFVNRVQFFANIKNFLKIIVGYSILKALLLINDKFNILYIVFLIVGVILVYLQSKLNNVTKRNVIYVILYVFFELLIIYQIESY
jgi:hypothetical protein